ncbi:hypothetical protein AMAG_16076 [Allomyces macrogynus ATCC 38327]|uniref:Uncharacterized protein n=1 Tax=Allomyces macrogynus (strain ATCC 38327) TaxID=578462 RepID=A0A0L0TAI3_ALLM3|nr:hypothetical protein AMAG_16076 [Allomyces macrogynus ATCC 38327]|eukprot:KNE71772.1 hypothetical protein AMAG_16076 [Allomyces macrogynus ATCC 38327]
MPAHLHSRTCSMQTEARPQSVFARPANAVVAAFKGTLRSVRAVARGAGDGNKKSARAAASGVSDDVMADDNNVHGKRHDSKAASTSASTELNVVHDPALPTVARRQRRDGYAGPRHDLDRRRRAPRPIRTATYDHDAHAPAQDARAPGRR